MRKFNDEQGRTWVVAISVDTIKRVRRELDIDLLDNTDGKLVHRLLADEVLLGDVIYAVCKPEAEKLGISQDDFDRAMLGDAIEHAVGALLAGITDFCRSQTRRANLKNMINKTRSAMDLAEAVIGEKIEAIDVDAIVNQAMRTSGSSSGSVPESSE